MGESLDIVIRKDASDEWLRSIMNKVGETGKSQQEGPIIPEVGLGARQEFFPLVVGVGFYQLHRLREKRSEAMLQQRMRGHIFKLDEFKNTMACQFVLDSGISIEVLYNQVADVASNAKKFYDESVTYVSNETFTNMLFLDGCFVLQFLFSFLRKPENLRIIRTEDAISVKRDLLLLENQLPFPVLQLLLSLRFKEKEEGIKLINDFLDYVRAVPPQQGWSKDVIVKFVRNYIWSPHSQKESTDRETEDQPAHLLELYHRKLTNKKKGVDRPQSGTWYANHSAVELKTRGIRFRPNRTNAVTDVKFKSTVFGGILELPHFTIDDSSKSLLLNLIEYERRFDTSGGLWVTSYVSFLDSLIQDAEDVKVLQSEGVLVNNLGRDQQVADLINEMAKHLLPNRYTYNDVRQLIELHYKGTIKKWIAECLRVYFRSPWTFIAFVAATIGLTLTAIQTYVAAFPRKR